MFDVWVLHIHEFIPLITSKLPELLFRPKTFRPKWAEISTQNMHVKPARKIIQSEATNCGILHESDKNEDQTLCQPVSPRSSSI
jgi:hypothetical protein